MMTIPGWLINISKAANIATFGPKHATLCARTYRNKHHRLVKVIDCLFWFDPDHCRKSYIQWRYKIMEIHDGQMDSNETD